MGAPPLAGDFPDRNSLIRLLGAVLAEQHDEWVEGRRYLGLDVLARSRMSIVPTDTTPETNTVAASTEVTAIPA